MRFHSRRIPTADSAPPSFADSAQSRESGEPGIPLVVAGYSVLRRLGQGRRSDIYLGHSATEGHRQVVLKVFRPATDPDSVEREITALAETLSGLATLIDVATLNDGRVCLVLERLRGDSLAHYLARYSPLAAGEAVTILAPVVVALRDLHAIGLVHAGLSQASVMISERGRPVLFGLGSLTALPARGADRTAFLRADYARLAVFMNGVLGELDRSDPRVALRTALVGWCEVAATATPFVPCLDQLERHLFEWAPATALSFAGDSAPDRDTGSGLAVVTTDAHGHLDPSAPARHRLGLSADAAELVTAVGDLMKQFRAAAASLLARVPDWGVPEHEPDRAPDTGHGRGSDRRRSGRRWSRVIYAASLATAATVAALVLLPAAAPDARRSAHVPGAAPSSTATVPAVAPSDTAALASDDPLAAVRVLLELRARCLAAASAACLEAADQQGGPLMAADTQSISMAAADPTFTQPAFTLGSDGTAELVERAGNSALIALGAGPAALSQGDGKSQPTSALVIKGEAGWRVRELFDY